MALFYLARLSVREIAARLGRPEGTIKRWLHLGRQRLAVEMEGYAPMTPPTTAATWAAAILSTDMDPAVLQSLVDAMKTAGWDDVATLGDGPVAERIVTGDGAEIHLSARLRGKQFIVLDDWIGGRSAFELYILMKAAAEGKRIVFGLLSTSAEDSTVWAVHLAGFDLFLIKPIDPEKFGRFSARILNSAKEEAGATVAP